MAPTRAWAVLVSVLVACAADPSDCKDGACPPATCPTEGFCGIDGLCVAAGVARSDDPCQACVPSTSTGAWSLAPGCTDTFFASPEPGFADGPLASARMRFPNAVWMAPDGAVYVSDTDNRRIRVIRDGTVGTHAGSGQEGRVDGPSEEVGFIYTSGITIDDSTGDMYITDIGANSLRLIRDGVVTTLAGDLSGGYREGLLADALFSFPLEIFFDDGRLYVIDTDNFRIRVVEDGVTRTIVGTGEMGFRDGPAEQALISDVRGFTVHDGKVYFADRGNARVRVLEDGVVRTIAGSGEPGTRDGPALQAQFIAVWDVAVMPDGRIYATDVGADTVREISDGQVRTIAGIPNQTGFADGPGHQAKFNDPFRIFAAPDGRLYIGDRENNRVRVVVPPTRQ